MDLDLQLFINLSAWVFLTMTIGGGLAVLIASTILLLTGRIK